MPTRTGPVKIKRNGTLVQTVSANDVWAGPYHSHDLPEYAAMLGPRQEPGTEVEVIDVGEKKRWRFVYGRHAGRPAIFWAKSGKLAYTF